MPVDKASSAERARQRQRALQRWDNEGGATPGHPAAEGDLASRADGAPPLSNAELVQMQIRVIALENLVIALLAQATEAQLEMVSDMAAYISPRPGHTPHPLTLGASAEMTSLVDRARQFRPTDETS